MHFTSALYLLVIGFLGARVVESIRVDWNTNKGPIIPPTPRTTPRPHLPYREPAPVWEDQSNDIPNPNPYVYVLPPPSRPRPATNNYLTADRRPVTQENYYLYNNQNNYGSLLPPTKGAAAAASAATATATTDYYQRSNGVVAGLSPKYIPNVGFKYFAIVPDNNANHNRKSISSSSNGLNNNANGYYGYNIGSDKLQGQYNAKTKKYKAYEKVKYVLPNYYLNNEFALPDITSNRLKFNQYDLLTQQRQQQQQQLPATSIKIPFNTGNLNEVSATFAIPVTPDKSKQQQNEQQKRQLKQQKQKEALNFKTAYSKVNSFMDEKPSKSNEKSSYPATSSSPSSSYNAIQSNPHSEITNSNATHATAIVTVKVTANNSTTTTITNDTSKISKPQTLNVTIEGHSLV